MIDVFIIKNLIIMSRSSFLLSKVALKLTLKKLFLIVCTLYSVYPDISLKNDLFFIKKKNEYLKIANPIR